MKAPDSEFTVAPTRFTPLASAHRAWEGLPIALMPLPSLGEVTDVEITDPSVHLICSGSGKRWLTSERRTREFNTVPGMVEFQARGTPIDNARWDGAEGEVIAIQLPACMVSRLYPDDARPLDLETRYEHLDSPLADLIKALWHQAACGSPHGALYVQGLTLALIGLLRTRYADRRGKQLRRIGKFGTRDTERLRAAINDQLSEDLRIERLAATVSMSPAHFAKMFKATFRQSPHAFILEQRIEAASRALRADRDRPIADIASQLGFSSQAHFTDAFRRRIGTTPARWRRDV